MKFPARGWWWLWAVAALLGAVTAWAQQGPPPASKPAAEAPVTDQALSTRTLRIGPGDELDISVYNVQELTQHTRVTGTGEIYLPLIGYVRVGGLTVPEAQAAIEKQLADGNFVKNPHVSIYVKEFSSETISIAGEVAKPGPYPAMQAHRLLDLIQAAGGLAPRAGRNVTIVHRDQPKATQTIVLSENAVETAQNNIDLLPGDTVVVNRAGIVYVIGEVNRAGGFVIDEQKGMTVFLAVTLANGPTNAASLKGARVIRRLPDGGLLQTPVPLKELLQAKAADVPLQADDVLWIPSAKRRNVLSPSALVNALSQAVIYRMPF